MKRARVVAVMLVIAVGCFRPSADAPRERSTLGGAAPEGFRWQRTEALSECVVPVRSDTGLQPMPLFTDSAALVSLAFSFLGERASRRTTALRRFVPGADGSLIQLADTTPGVVDGTHSVYVSSNGCVTLVGP